MYEPIHGDTPQEIDEGAIFKLGIDSIKARFLFMQKFFPILMILIWIIVMSIPYLTALPAIYISLVVTIVSVVAGISLRPFLENIIAGVIISFFQPIRIGDTVLIQGKYGVVERIDLTQCVLRIWDWERYVIPNSKMLTKEIQNLTMHDSQVWAHISFWVEPDCDLDEVEKISTEAAARSDHGMGHENPAFWVTKMEKDSVECWVASWADNPSDAWELRSDMRKYVHQGLRKAGIRFHSFNANLGQSEKAGTKT